MSSKVATVADNYKRANQDIGPRVKKGKLSFLSRKIYNCLIFRAQESGLAGKGAPAGAALDCEDASLFWWLPLSDLVKNASFNSKDTAIVKEMLTNLQTTIVERVGRGWESDQLLGSVEIKADLNNNRGGGKLYVGYSFPRKIENLILAPDQYTRMSIFYQGELRSEASLVLYEICKRFETNPGRVTSRASWQDWADRMGVHAAGTEYRYFKRDTLKKAIDEVNKITDIIVKLEEDKAGGRAVVNLQFSITTKQQQGMPLQAKPAIDTDAVVLLTGLGISISEAEKIVDDKGSEAVIAAANLVQKRIADTSKSPLESPAGYFKTALAGNWAEGVAEVAKKAEAKTAAHVKMIEASREQNDVKPVPLPEGEALGEAWMVFLASPSAKLFKKLPAAFAEASKPAQKSFAGWWSAQKV